MIKQHHSSLDKKKQRNDRNKKEINKNRIQKNTFKTNEKLKIINNIVSRNENHFKQSKLNKQKENKNKRIQNNQNIQTDRLKRLQKNLKQNNQSILAKDQQTINKKNQQQRILIEVGQYVKRQSQSKGKHTIPPYRNNTNKNTKQTVNNLIQLQSNSKNMQKKQQKKFQINNQQVQKIDIKTKRNLQTEGNKDNKTKKSNNYKSQLNYKRFFYRNIQKIVKAEKEIIKLNKSKEKISQNYTSTINTNRKEKKPKLHLQTNQSLQLNQSILKNSLNRSFQSVYRDQKKYQQKKKQKIIQLRQSQYRKQLQQATFKPKSFTSSYKSTNQLLKPNQTSNNFYQRLKKDNQNRNTHQLKQIAQIMQECPFKPRLNLQTRHSKSIVKNIWSSTEKISTLVKNIKRNSIQKLTIMHNKSQNTSLIGTAQIPLIHTNQLSFLLK